ncbi:MAG: protein YgfX [Thiotrichaceae bacterium]
MLLFLVLSTTMFDNLLILKIYPSRQLAIILSILHGFAWVTMWLPLQLPEFVNLEVVRITLTLLIFMSYLHSLRYHIYLIGHPLRDCVLYHDDVWLPDEQVAAIDSSSYYHTQLVILWARLPSGQKYSLIIFHDAMEATQFRQLRVRLQHRFR